jgi:uncharacterized membrane protein
MRRNAALLTIAIVATLTLLPTISRVQAQSFVQYRVQLSSDGSAAWTITQASDLTGTIDTWVEFQQRVANLINSARTLTQREMSLDNNTLQLSTVWETQSHTTKYQFTWFNFSMNQSAKLVIGDVFQVSDFFDLLYGNGEIEIGFPITYRVESVSPQPNGDQTNPQTLDWLGTQFFVNGNPSVTLAGVPTPTPTPDQESNNAAWQIYVIVISIVGLTAASLIGLYDRRRKIKASEQVRPKFAPPSMESDEEKIVKIVQANGGSEYQSAINEKLRFSKAKTSQLLTGLEKKGIVTRYKKGRDKIVSLTEKGKAKNFEDKT